MVDETWISVGQRVRYDNTSSYGFTRVEQDDVVTVFRVGTDKALVKPEVPKSGDDGAFWIPINRLRPADSPPPRPIGKTPEGDFIAVDDPRVAWIWEDAAKIAAQEGYCSQYDRLTDKLGAPGRVRTFRVRSTVNGLDVTASVKAHSRTEAQALVAAKIGGTADFVEEADR